MIYLDNAATSWPKPPRVHQAVARFLAEEAGGPNRAGHRMSVRAARVVQEVRARLARLFRADEPERMIFCLNCTDALNMALKGCLREGDHVVTTVLEHNSVNRPLQALVDARFITLTRLPITAAGSVDPDAVRKAITPKTRLLATLHASNVMGTVQPAAELGRIAREHDILFLLDAAQSAGVLEVDVREMHVDLLTFPGHKSLLGPTGTGGLYAGPRAELRPWREGGTGGDSVTPTQPRELPTWLEAGTPNTVGLAGLNASLEGLQPDTVHAHEQRLVRRLRGALADDERIRIVGPTCDVGVGVVSLLVRGVTPQDAAAILDESFGICVRPGLHCAPFVHRALGTFPDGTVRVSVGHATTDAEVDQLAAALREIAA
ncbi:MAG: aminotransferase class V-fold PLP-dependent enzyme [Planctomycetes bacterium]|nr:aminotransferase class V-fold PLP-dependent enzyme [Planctomycetota bacterium]